MADLSLVPYRVKIHTELFCGCRLMPVATGDGRLYNAEFFFCPMHKAAPELLTACQDLVAMVKDEYAEVVRAKAVIAKVEGSK